MDRIHIPLLAEVLELYYTFDELMEMASIFDVAFADEAIWRNQRFSWLAASRQLIERIDHGNHYKMLESVGWAQRIWRRLHRESLPDSGPTGVRQSFFGAVL